VTTSAVAVLMSVHNGAPWVGEAIASVLTQTERDLELIIVDDGSTDDTPAVVREAAAGGRLAAAGDAVGNGHRRTGRFAPWRLAPRHLDRDCAA
jgi:glycosyltransferase involved in cell wall biosynthesis